MKIFPDTNVWLSALVFPGLCAELVASVFESDHRLLTSELVRAEVQDVVRQKFARHAVALENFTQLWGQALLLPDVAEPAGDADARLVEAAARGGTDFFVTGDKRVLGWEAIRAMRIVTPRQMWHALQPGSQDPRGAVPLGGR